MADEPKFTHRQPVRVVIGGVVDAEYDDGSGTWRVVVEFQADRRRLLDVPWGVRAVQIFTDPDEWQG